MRRRRRRRRRQQKKRKRVVADVGLAVVTDTVTRHHHWRFVIYGSSPFVAFAAVFVFSQFDIFVHTVATAPH